MPALIWVSPLSARGANLPLVASTVMPANTPVVFWMVSPPWDRSQVWSAGTAVSAITAGRAPAPSARAGGRMVVIMSAASSSKAKLFFIVLLWGAFLAPPLLILVSFIKQGYDRGFPLALSIGHLYEKIQVFPRITFTFIKRRYNAFPP